MDGRNSVVLAERAEEQQTGYEALSAENVYLKLENKRLHQENEQLREVFSIATVEFNKKNREIDSLRSKVKKALSTIDLLTEENAELKQRLELAEGKVKLLQHLAFGKKSEKQVQEGIPQREHKKRGAVSGHKGRGRKIPNEMPVIDEIIDIPNSVLSVDCLIKR